MELTEIYNALKGALSIAGQIKNIELRATLLDVEQMTLELQAEVLKLRQENQYLRDLSKLEQKIVRHESTYITLKDDPQNIIYCACCWDGKKILMQVNCSDSGEYTCPECKNSGVYNKEMYKASMRKLREENDRLNAVLNYNGAY